jgi:hypothetical protein
VVWREERLWNVTVPEEYVLSGSFQAILLLDCSSAAVAGTKLFVQRPFEAKSRVIRGDERGSR